MPDMKIYVVGKYTGAGGSARGSGGGGTTGGVGGTAKELDLGGTTPKSTKGKGAVKTTGQKMMNASSLEGMAKAGGIAGVIIMLAKITGVLDTIKAAIQIIAAPLKMLFDTALMGVVFLLEIRDYISEYLPNLDELLDWDYSAWAKEFAADIETWLKDLPDELEGIGDDIEDYFDDKSKAEDSVTEDITNGFLDFATWLGTFAVGVGTVVKDAALEWYEGSDLKVTIDNIIDTWDKLSALTWDDLEDLASETFTDLIGLAGLDWADIEGLAGKSWEGLKNLAGWDWKDLKELGHTSWTGMRWLAGETFQGVKNLLDWIERFLGIADTGPDAGSAESIARDKAGISSDSWNVKAYDWFGEKSGWW